MKKSTITTIIVILGVAILLILSPRFLNNNSGTNVEALITEGDWVKGNSEAVVELIEYSDFQCPACAAYYPIVKRLEEELGEDMKFSYRHFPLSNIHANAEPAARASEAAGIQGKFWEMHDILFEKQKEWSSSTEVMVIFAGYAEELELDIEKFRTDFESKNIKDKIENMYKSGLSLKVNATPTFFLNGEKMQNPRNYEELKTAIESKILELKEENNNEQ